MRIYNDQLEVKTTDLSTTITSETVNVAMENLVAFQIALQATALHIQVAIQVSLDEVTRTSDIVNWTTFDTWNMDNLSGSVTNVVRYSDMCHQYIRVVITNVTGTGTLSSLRIKCIGF
jgi:preprotein translocase subunit SecB